MSAPATASNNTNDDDNIPWITVDHPAAQPAPQPQYIYEIALANNVPANLVTTATIAAPPDVQFAVQPFTSPHNNTLRQIAADQLLHRLQRRQLTMYVDSLASDRFPDANNPNLNILTGFRRDNATLLSVVYFYYSPPPLPSIVVVLYVGNPAPEFTQHIDMIMTNITAAVDAEDGYYLYMAMNPFYWINKGFAILRSDTELPDIVDRSDWSDDDPVVFMKRINVDVWDDGDAEVAEETDNTTTTAYDSLMTRLEYEQERVANVYPHVADRASDDQRRKIAHILAAGAELLQTFQPMSPDVAAASIIRYINQKKTENIADVGKAIKVRQNGVMVTYKVDADTEATMITGVLLYQVPQNLEYAKYIDVTALMTMFNPVATDTTADNEAARSILDIFRNIFDKYVYRTIIVAQQVPAEHVALLTSLGYETFGNPSAARTLRLLRPLINRFPVISAEYGRTISMPTYASSTLAIPAEIYDQIELKDTPLADYLAANPQNVVFASATGITALERDALTRLLFETPTHPDFNNLFYACRELDTTGKFQFTFDDIHRDVIYFNLRKLGVLTGGYLDVRYLLRVLAAAETNDNVVVWLQQAAADQPPLPSVISLQNFHAMDSNLSSSAHCQAGHDGPVFVAALVRLDHLPAAMATATAAASSPTKRPRLGGEGHRRTRRHCHRRLSAFRL